MGQGINKDTGLTTGQEQFCKQYLFPFTTDKFPELRECDMPYNGVRAVERAGYKGNVNTLNVTSVKFLQKTTIQAYLAKLKKPMEDRYKVSKEKIESEMATLAFSNMGDYLEIDEETGEAWIDVSKCTREELGAIQQFENVELPPQKSFEGGEEVVREVVKTKVKLYDKRLALEALGKHHGFISPDKVEVNITTDIDLTDRMDIAKKMAFILRQGVEADKKLKKKAKKEVETKKDDKK